MPSDTDSDDYHDSNSETSSCHRQTKRRKISRSSTRLKGDEDKAPVCFSPLLQALDKTQDVEDFEDLVRDLLPVYSKKISLVSKSEKGENNSTIRPLSRIESLSMVRRLGPSDNHPTIQNLVQRKLKIQQDVLDDSESPAFNSISPMKSITDILTPQNEAVISALESVKVTPYECSFASRLNGLSDVTTRDDILAVDWETISPWMHVMQDVFSHYHLSHPERFHPTKIRAPLVYETLQKHHLSQVHDLLIRVFWDGINVQDSLDHNPERCTVVATYKRLVVGVAILSSPHETYITYLAVKAGWENSKIATSMLYQLIILNPHKDITLHVSTNNPAMLLYNRFGFKAEEFIAGFYENFLSPLSRGSRNAFLLRLRQR